MYVCTYVCVSQLGHNVIKMALKWKSKRVSASLTSTQLLCEEVELSNMRTVYLMHIPSTLILTSEKTTASENPDSVPLQSTSFYCYFRCSFSQAACYAQLRDVQCKTRDHPKIPHGILGIEVRIDWCTRLSLDVLQASVNIDVEFFAVTRAFANILSPLMETCMDYGPTTEHFFMVSQNWVIPHYH